MSPQPDPHPTDDLLEELVAGALERLDQGGDPALQQFLAEHPEHHRQIEHVVAGFRGTGLLRRDAGSDLPERLGEFRLLERLGGGGMGVVFVAEQESLRRIVALKVIRPDLLYFTGTRERFRREIEVIARLSHPAIVPIVATGEHDGMPWYAMPRVPGCSGDEAVRRLRTRDPANATGIDLWRAIQGDDDGSTHLDRSTFAGSYWEACVRLVRQAALGLEHAHREGVVHRDVKPSNLMLTPDGRALLLDFGLARVAGDAKLTRTGSEPGSPAYMAPEQLRGEPADERTDVYSLAATLWHLLELEAPFGAPDPESLRAAILRGRERGPHNRALPLELRIVLSVAMDIDRERRYASASAFADDLDAVLSRRSIAARPLPRRVRAARWLQRHRRVSVALMIAAALAIALPAVVVWQQSRSLAEVRREQQLAEQSRDQALRAIHVFLTQFASGGMTRVPGAQRIAEPLLRGAMAMLDSMPPGTDPGLVRPNRLRAERWWISALVSAGRLDEALQRIRAVLPDPGAATTVDLPPTAAYVFASLRHELVCLALRGVAVPDIDAERDRAEREIDVALTDPDQRRSALELRVRLTIDHAELLGRRGENAVARARLQAALQALPTGDPAPDLVSLRAIVLNRIGERALADNDLDAAEAAYTAARTTLPNPPDPALGAPDHLGMRAYALRGLAHVQLRRKHTDESAALFEDARDQYERFVSAYPDDAIGVSNFAGLLTEFAQVKARRGAPDGEVLAMLERGRRLFAHAAQLGGAGAMAIDNLKINLATLSELHWRAHDGHALAAIARDLAKAAPGDAMRQSMAAWRSLQAAAMLDEHGERAAASACEDDAMAALLACDAAGWFPPVDLDDAPCQRLRGRAEFDALHAKHPPEQATRRRPR